MINPLSVLFMLVTAVFNMSVQDDPVSAFADKVADARVRLEYSYLADDGGMKLSGKGIATVQVNTWIKKKSDSIKDLKKDYFHWSKNGPNYNTQANAVAHHPSIQAPAKEPYYTYGLITK